MWRWDQGRLLYFQFDVLRDIAKTLVKFDNADISKCENLFRQTLVTETGMPFLPDYYTVKRNYSRVFQCSFLAKFMGNQLVVTDICRDLANADGEIKSADDYLFNYVSKFRFPFPAFDKYNATEQRQLREMVIFISQLSVLKVYDGFLYLDEISDGAKDEMLNNFLRPENRFAKADRMEEFLEMTSLSDKIVVPTFEVFTSEPSDIEFIEGNRKRVEHFRVERSGLLKKYYKKVNPNPVCCACGADMSKRYPWTDYMLDIHHLLPLSSAVAISSSGTSLADIVGLCPSCHRAVHMYYRKWLRANEQADFKSKQEAHDVFVQATKEIA